MQFERNLGKKIIKKIHFCIHITREKIHLEKSYILVIQFKI